MTAYSTTTYADATAVMGRRIGAFLINLILGLAIVMAVAVPVFSSRAEKRFPRDPVAYCEDLNTGNRVRCLPIEDTAYVISEDAQNDLAKAVYAAFGAWLLINSVVIQGLAGGSVGKLLVGLRVVRHDGRRAGIVWCALRTLVLLVDVFLCAIGLVTSLSTAGHRRLGDMAASTLVVGRQYEGAPPPVPRLLDGRGPRPRPLAMTGGGPPSGPEPGAPATTVAPDGPTWDPARSAYIQYDYERSAWMQWNDVAEEWRPIDQ